ncbi:uncharacterized protein LOC131503916 isoform X2 [Neofelis nebulosa]|uniref:uncharacterized protein LOC131503916 isoform X2 n=1 Tax=Neofelis nebulosa TaxID=61452 RepID=UPI00272D6243|nr:uncharacterized protein LOC131503916 isoform X2 [Neofelis nebulosa]
MARLDLNMESQDPPGKEDRELLTDRQETQLHIPSPLMDKPPGQNPVGLGEENPVSVSTVTVKGTQESHRHRQGPLMAMLDLNMESRDPPRKEDRQLRTDRQETPLDTPSLGMDKPPGQNPVGLGEENPVSVSPVTLKGTQESHRHRQGPLMARLDLNMESQDPPGKEDRELHTDRQETQLHIPSPLMDKPPGQNPLGPEERDLASVSPVTRKRTQESHRQTKDPLMAMPDLNMESWDPPGKEDRDLLTDSKKTPLDMHCLVMDRPPTQNPVGLGEENPVSVSPVTLKGTQESHRHRQGPLMAMLDLNMESRDPPRKEDRQLRTDRQETPLDTPSLGMDKPPGHNPVGLGEENPVSVSPVTLKGIQESHSHRQGPLMARLDLNMESRDPPGKEDRGLRTDRQETQLHIPSPLMDKPPGQNPVGQEEKDLGAVSPVTGEGLQESHRHRQGPLMAMLDLNMESWDPPGKEDQKLLTDSKETPLDKLILVLDRPPGQNLAGPKEADPVSVNRVTGKGTQDSHRHTQGPLMARLDLNMESRDPPGKEDRELLTDRQETPLDIPSPLMDKPPGQNLVGLGEENPVSVSPVTLKGTQESHSHRQGPLMARLDLNMESRDPPGKEDRELLTDRQETQLHIPSPLMDKPPGQNPVGLGEDNPVSVSPVTLKGTQESHRHRQGPLMAILDSNRESQDPPMKEDGKLLTYSKEIPLANLNLVMDRPPGQKLAGPKEADPVSVNQVTGKGTQDSHRHTPSPLMARLDLSMKSQDPPGKEDRVLLKDSKEIPLDMHCLVMDRPPGQNPVEQEEQDLGAVSPMTREGLQESHRHRQGPLMAMVDLNMQSRDPPRKQDQKLLTDSKETPLDKLILVLDRPPGQNLAGPKEADPVPVNRVTGKGTQDSHRHTQGPLMARLDLNMESWDPPGKEDRELLTDRQETPLDIPSPLMDKPPGQNLVGLGEENPVSVSPVTVKGTQESHRHRQGPLMAMLDLNMESQDPPRKEDRELCTDRQETPLDTPSLGMDKPPGQNPVGLGEENPVSVRTGEGLQESHRHTQRPLMAMLDLNLVSQHLPMKVDWELLTHRQETPLDLLSLVMDKPPAQNPGGLEERDLV